MAEWQDESFALAFLDVALTSLTSFSITIFSLRVFVVISDSVEGKPDEEDAASHHSHIFFLSVIGHGS